jgi:long-chain fatty acid transport protein
MYQATPDTRMGLAYRSQVKQKLDGTSSSTYHALDAAPYRTPNSDISADLTLPENLSFSVLSHLNSKLEIMADATWKGWSRFQELKVVLGNGSQLINTSENWHDTMRYSIGATINTMKN